MRGARTGHRQSEKKRGKSKEGTLVGEWDKEKEGPWSTLREILQENLQKDTLIGETEQCLFIQNTQTQSEQNGVFILSEKSELLQLRFEGFRECNNVVLKGPQLHVFAPKAVSLSFRTGCSFPRISFDSPVEVDIGPVSR